MKNITNLIYSIIVATIIYSCSINIENSSKVELDINFIDSLTRLSIPLPYLLYSSNGAEINPAFYSMESQSLKVYNPTFKDIIWEDSLSLTFPNLRIRNAMKLPSNKFCLLTDTSIVLASKTKIENIKINAVEPVFIGHYPDIHTVPLYAFNESIFLHRLNVECEGNDSKFCKNQSLITEVDTKLGIQKDLPIYYPRCYFEQSFPRSLRITSMVPVDSILVFNFAMDENLYTYNIVTENLIKINCRSRNQLREIKGINSARPINEKSQTVMDFYLTTPRYSRLTFDPYYKKYYRIFTQGQDLMNKDRFFNSRLDAKTFVMVLNEDFTNVGEFEIDTKKYNYGIVPTKNGLAVPRRKLVNNTYQYDIFQIKF